LGTLSLGRIALRRILVPTLLFWVCNAAYGQAAAARRAPAIKPGVERWSVKTSLPPNTDFSKAQTISFADLAALPDAPGVVKNDPRYQSSRIPEKIAGKYTEGQLLSVTAYIWLVGLESDGDYHIQISATNMSGDHCVIVEASDPNPAFTADTTLQPKTQAVRALIKSKMLAGQDPSTFGSLMLHPVYVTVTGILFYDDAHIGDPPRGKKGMHAAGLWELHPVTNVAFAVKP
jgi:hypothetical protein